MYLRAMPNVFHIYALELWVPLHSSLLLKNEANMDFWTVYWGSGESQRYHRLTRHKQLELEGWGEGGVGTTVKALYIIMLGKNYRIEKLLYLNTPYLGCLNR